MWLWFGWLVACQGGCPEGSVLTASGECREGDFDAEVPWVQGVVEGISVRECTLGSPGTTLDLLAGCAGGICRSDPYEDFTASLGTPDCDATSSTAVACDWANGIGAHFPDENGDGVPDPGSPGTVLVVEEPFPGTDENGLGLGMSLGCFVEVFGLPEEIETTAYDADTVVARTARFDVDGIAFNTYDWDAVDGGAGVDGFIDGIHLFGF